MSAFVVVDTKIKNNHAYEEYKKLAKPIAEKYGGVYRARGGSMEVRETTLWTPTRVVIIEFPDLQSARAFLDSKEYAQVKPLRQNNADCTLFILDGM
ncbi:MAG: DUF1330 domain-containing protein [Gammaproteobacteria bacterium]|nr:DUF1330 domain-containing protein [Gammaproteobacteria bacterium]